MREGNHKLLHLQNCYRCGRMSRIKEKEIKEIRIAVEKEFSEDPALQQVHIARKIIAKEA
jgi:hypothetical protein